MSARLLQRYVLALGAYSTLLYLLQSMLRMNADYFKLRAIYPGEPHDEADMPFPRFSSDITNEDLDRMSVVCYYRLCPFYLCEQ